MHLALWLTGAALAVCDDPIFSVLPAPVPDGDKPGVETGKSTLNGRAVVGGRFSFDSAHPLPLWKDVLLDVESQDEWVPDKFGYEAVHRIDDDHVYMRFDIGFLFNAVRVRRQVVVRNTSGEVGDRFRTCWRMVDPAPFLPGLEGVVAPEVDWERTSTGWWEVTPQADGSALVNYQWWAESGKVPVAIQRFGISRTLPDLLRAFEARVGVVAGKR